MEKVVYLYVNIAYTSMENELFDINISFVCQKLPSMKNFVYDNRKVCASMVSL